MALQTKGQKLTNSLQTILRVINGQFRKNKQLLLLLVLLL